MDKYLYLLFIIFFIINFIICFLSIKFFENKFYKKIIDNASDLLENSKKEIDKIEEERIKNINLQLNEIIKNSNEKIELKLEEIKRKETELESKEKNMNIFSENLLRKEKNIKDLKEELDDLKKKKLEDLEKVAFFSIEEAKKHIHLELENEIKFKSSVQFRKIIDQTNLESQREAKKIIISAMQRLSAEQSIENSSTSIPLEDNAQKGIIIGKEGRNIKSIEAMTGVDVIIDETPNLVVVSSFDPIRREIAKISIQNLLKDGRVYPGKIEEIVSKVESDIENKIFETGEKTILDLKIYGLDIKLIKLVGRMQYRTSYGQNLLSHSKEVANLCTILAAELGLDIEKAKRAGLLHDIGKVSNEDPTLTHAILGMKIAKECGECEQVCNAIGAHHNEIEMNFLISPIIQICDSISGARPGARKDIAHEYIKRMQDIEKIGMNYQGVKNCYAVQSGKELRIIVDSESISENEAFQISFDVARKLEKEIQFPGQIKVIVVREKKFIDIAKF